MILGGALIASQAVSLACECNNAADTATTTGDQFYIIENPGGTIKVALDRRYSDTHIWVKDIGDDVVMTGVTDKFQKLMGNAVECSLSLPNNIIKAEDIFGTVGARKFNADLISPVSGEVIETNLDLTTYPSVARINSDPYGNGWMLKIKLSYPEELDDLLSPMYYAYLQTQNWTGPVPEMH
jgi:glycine cleavage system H protein